MKSVVLLNVKLNYIQFFILNIFLDFFRGFSSSFDILYVISSFIFISANTVFKIYIVKKYVFFIYNTIYML